MCVMKITNMSKRQSRHQMYDDVTSFFWPVDIAQHLFWYVQSTWHNACSKCFKKTSEKKFDAAQKNSMLRRIYVAKFSIFNSAKLVVRQNCNVLQSKKYQSIYFQKKVCFAILSNEAGFLILYNFSSIWCLPIPISNAIYIMKIVN